MSRVGLAIASLFLGAAALAAPSLAQHPGDHAVRADIGWGVVAPSPGETAAPAPTSGVNDIGWG
ncbi:hypothetical protein BX257_4719 [Streptomyces sp. 3212.3]|uniref:hypothetical protein n=1 Tax=Streptomyces sp. 3212.3 TaxID=1938846 RepID=UPI000E39F8ED|nr:hypothetical protein [Streptomyces sp. 3212.3]REE62106.1 hypothetical protein BX257_4719 [Streptomyces sp. 3212.3]